MSNATRCRTRAAKYAALAKTARTAEERRSYETLQRLWLDMAPLAESYDRASDEGAKQRIYEMMDAVGQQRRKVA